MMLLGPIVFQVWKNFWWLLIASLGAALIFEFAFQVARRRAKKASSKESKHD